jgi:hypothetical protein
MDVITNGTVASVEHSLLVAQPGTQVHFHGAIDAIVGVLPYGFATIGEAEQVEWSYGDPLARPRAAHRAAEHVVARAGVVSATAIAQA